MSESNPPAAEPRHLTAVLRWVLFVAAAFGIVAFTFGWAAKSMRIDSPVVTPEPSTGVDAPQPDFRLATLGGDRLGPQDFAGQVVVVDFWASWCGPCRIQEKHLAELHTELADAGIQFLGVNLGEDEETVREFVAGSPFPYPVLLDPESDLMSPYRIHSLPTLLIVDAAGQISYLESGVHDREMIRRQIEKARQGTPSA